jgi:uncharacterized membrane protein HdeD (DUF308 family)
MATEQTIMPAAQVTVTASLQTHWRTFLVEGIVLAILGVLAIAVPPIASLAVAILVGWLLLASGIAGLIGTLRMRGAPGFGWSLLSAVIGIAAGIVLLAQPLSGIISLTLVLSVFLLCEGIFSIMLALQHRGGASGRWTMLLFSGLVDMILAALIFAGLPGTAAWAIGLLVGINLLFGGVALISMALHARAGR